MEVVVRLDPGARRREREDTIAAFVDLGLVVMIDGVGLGKQGTHRVLESVVRHLSDWRGEPWSQARDWRDHPLPVALQLTNLHLVEWLAGKAGHRREAGASLVAALRVDDGVLLVRAGAGRVCRLRDGQVTSLLAAHALRHLDYRRMLPDGHRPGGMTPLAPSPSLGQKDMTLDVRFERLAPGDLLLVGPDALLAQVDEASLEEALEGGTLDAMADRLLSRCHGSLERVAFALARWELPAGPAVVAPPAPRMRAAVRHGRAPHLADWASAVPRFGLALFTDGESEASAGPSAGDTTVAHRDLRWLSTEAIVGVMDEVVPRDPRVVVSLLATGIWLANTRQQYLNRYLGGRLLPCRTVAAVARVVGGVLCACLGAGSVHRVRAGRLEAMVGGQTPPASAREPSVAAHEAALRHVLDRQGQGSWQVRFEPLAPGDRFVVGGASLVAQLGEAEVARVLSGDEPPLRAMADRLRAKGDERGAGSFVLASWEGEETGDAHGFHTVEAPPMETASRLDLGKERSQQEDATLVDPELGLALVIDAMGGGGTGEVAARVLHECLAIVTKAWQGLTWDEGRPWGEHSLPASIRLAHLMLLDAMKALSFTGCGGTVAAVQRVGEGVLVAHVGNSRVYRWRAGALELLTEDHSLLNDYRKAMPMTAREIAEFPYRNVITRALGVGATVEVDVRFERLAPGDLFLVCSDGVTDEIDDAAVAEALAGEVTLEAVADRLLAAVLATEARDNLSLVLVRWG